jgi:diguanylate cyclase
MAAQASVAQLQQQAPLDLWLVSFVEGTDQVIVSAAATWAQEISPGLVAPWAHSFCFQMIRGRDPAVAPRAHEVPAYAAAAAAS